MVDAGAVEDVAAGEGADGAVGRFVLPVAEVAEGLAGPHSFEVVVFRARGRAAGGRDVGCLGGGSCWRGCGG